jgi:hypothetical protein
MSAQVIELDTTQPRESPEPRLRLRRPPRWLVPVIVLTVGSSAMAYDAPVGSPYAPILTRNETSVMHLIGGDTLYEAPSDAFEPKPVRAFDLKTGRLRWQRESGTGGIWSVVGEGLFQAIPDNAIPDDAQAFGRSPSVLRALDPATGRTLWERANADAVLATANWTILLEWRPRSAPEPDDAGPDRPVVSTVYAVESRTGRVVWRREFAAAWTFVRHTDDWASLWGMAQESIAIAELSPGGDLQIIDVGTGRTTPPVHLSVGATVDYLDVVGDIATVREGEDLISYDVHSGRQLSRTRIAEGGFRCGPVYMCLTGLDANGLGTRVIRRETGEIVLDLPNTMITGQLGDRLLLQSDLPSTVRPTWLVDLAGDPRPRDLAPWTSARVIDGRRVLAVAQAPRERKATVAVIDIETSRAVVVAEIRGSLLPIDCDRVGNYVLCFSGSEHGVWRLPAELRL